MLLFDVVVVKAVLLLLLNAKDGRVATEGEVRRGMLSL